MPMRIIAFMNQKGGVGKTTTAVNLGAALAEAGQRVCMVDLDPQAHLTINYGIEPSADHVNLYDVLIDEQHGFREALHTAVATGPQADAAGAAGAPNSSDSSVAPPATRPGATVAIAPSSIDLAAAEIELVSVLGREMILKKRVEAAGIGNEFDFMILDCPPSLGLLTINALALASEVIIPMQAHFLALQGVAKLLETVQLVNKRMNPRLKVSGIVLTMFDAQTKLGMEVVAELEGFIEQGKKMAAEGKPQPWSEALIFKTRIRRNIKLAESPSFGQTILTYEPTSNGAADYRALAAEVMAMGKSVPKPVPDASVSIVAPSLSRAVSVDVGTVAKPQAANATASAAISTTEPAVAKAALPVAQPASLEVTVNVPPDTSKLAAAHASAAMPNSVKPPARPRRPRAASTPKKPDGSEVAA